jgi:hypothetical protein
VPGPYPGFDGIANADQGGQLLPPDPVGDVGPNHYVQAVNTSWAVYAKNGTRLRGPEALTSLWPADPVGLCDDQGHGDPIVLYDELADRWLLAQFAFVIAGSPAVPTAPFKMCIAVSQGPDPTGAWFPYEFSMITPDTGHENDLPDYPKLAVWHDAYYLSANAFQVSPTAAVATGAIVAAFNRTNMLAGQSAEHVVDWQGSPSGDPDDIPYGLLPVDLDGLAAAPAGTPGLYVSFTDTNFSQTSDTLHLWRFQASFSPTPTGTFQLLQSFPVSGFDSALCGGTIRACIPQPEGATRLDPIAGQLMHRAAYRNRGGTESIVLNHSVDASGTDHAGIRWYELRRTGGAGNGFGLAQEGTFAPDADHRWMGSAAMDASGNVAIGYSVSGPGTYPSLRFTGRYASDPGGTLTQGEGLLVAGTGAQTSTTSRWGDYSSLSVDPADGCTFWFTGEYYAGTSDRSWRTRIGSFSLVTDPTVVSPTHAVEAWSSRASADFAFSGATASCGLAGYSYAWDTVPTTIPDAVADIGAATTTLAGLPLVEGQPAYLHVRSVDTRGNGGPGLAVGPFRFDGTAPTDAEVTGAALQGTFRVKRSFTVSWTASDATSGVASFDLRTRLAKVGGAFTRPAELTGQPVGGKAGVKAVRGATYCFAVSARDAAGNASPFSKERCTAVPLDDTDLERSGDFRRQRLGAAFGGTVTVGSSRGSILLRRATLFRRLAIVATRCPDCGTIGVYLNGKLLRTIRLEADTVRRQQVIPVARFANVRRGPIAIQILSEGKRVEIDGLGFRRT